MEEKDKDVPVGSVSESTVTESEHVAGETPVVSVDNLVQGQIDESFSEGIVDDSCHGDDIMVEVLGSDVYVGGVCTSGSGDHLDDEADHGGPIDDGQGGLERHLNVFDGLDSGAAGFSGGEASNHGIGTGVEGSLRTSESQEERVQVTPEVEVGVVTREESLEEAAVEAIGRERQVISGCNEAQDVGICADDSAAVGSAGGEIQNNHAMDVGVVSKEEGVDEKMHEAGADSGVEALSAGSDSIEGVSGQGVDVQDEKERDPSSRHGMESSSVGAQCGEAQVIVEEVTVTGCVELATEVVEEGKLVGNDSLIDVGMQKVGVSDDEASHFRKKCSADVENSSIETQVLDENNVGHEETVGGSSEGHSNVNADVESSSQSKQEIVEGELAVTDSNSKVDSISEKDESLKSVECLDTNMAPNISQVESNVGQEMEIDKKVIDSEFVASDGDREKGTEVPRPTERDQPLKSEDSMKLGRACDVSAISSFTAQEMEVEEKGTEVPRPTERDQPLKSEDSMKLGRACDVSAISSVTAQEMEVEEKAIDAQQVAFYNGQQIESEENKQKCEKMGGEAENEGTDMISSCQPTQVVDVEVTAPSENISNPVDIVVLPIPTGKDETSKAEPVSIITETDSRVVDDVDIVPMDTDDVLISVAEEHGHLDNNLKLNRQEFLRKSEATNYGVSESNIAFHEGVKKQVTDSVEFNLRGEQDSAMVKEATDREQPNTSEEKLGKREQPGSLSMEHQLGYHLPQENEGVFSVPDLVWGKIKSHPWWPGQIFDFTDASEMALKYHKKDYFLIAYFGDRSFAWNDASSLKPFRTHFSQMGKQCNSESFQNAVDCALEEVSRRVELGLACSCVPKEAYDEIKFQIVENAGIRPESSRRDEVDESASGSSFQADKLIEYVKSLARFPSGGANQLDVAVAKAQLLAFSRFKGYSSLPEFQFCGGLVEDTEASSFRNNLPSCELFEPATHVCVDDGYPSLRQEMLNSRASSSRKRKHNLRDGVYAKVKEKSLTELMGGEFDSLDGDNWSGKKRKGADDLDDDSTQDGRRTISVPKVSNSASSPKQSFKVGEWMRRAASNLKGNNEKIQKLDGSSDVFDISFSDSEDVYRGRVVDPTECSSLDELLEQLQFIAQDPMREHNFSNVIVNFFSDFRNSVITGQSSRTEHLPVDKVSGRRKKSVNSVSGSPATFEFDDMNDTYWTDRVIQNGSEEQAPRKSRKRDNQPARAEKPPQVTRRPYSRKRYSNGEHAVVPEKPAGYVSENAPAELVMNFSEVRSVPSETNLNKMFRRFGPLKEMETEVDWESSRARVIFKKTKDAEVAFNSAGKFNIFGPTPVNYQLNYTLSVPFKASSVAATHDHEMQLDLSTHDHELQLDLSTHDHEMQLDLSTHDHDMHLDLSTFELV